MWEEPPISGSRGSGTVFFSGCGLGCVYCQNRAVSRASERLAGTAYPPERLAELMRRTEALGVHNISFVTGTQYVPDIIAALRIYRPRVPLVWNSGGYELPSVVDALAPYIDIWLPDYKYALTEPAAGYSGAPDYPEKAIAAIKRMRMHTPADVFGDDGVMLSGMIVRQLVLPLNTRNSIAALERIASELPGTLVSVMGQYTPVSADDRFPELSRRITRREYDKVCDAAARLGLKGFTQELSSAKTGYIPDFL